MTKPEYLHWSQAGGPNECEHGYAEGIPCPNCDANPRIQELRAEVERLKEELETTTKAYIGCCALVTNAEAEVERLKEELGYCQIQRDDARYGSQQHQAENERLRAFVQKVALYSNDAWLAREADELAPGASL